MVCRVVEFYRTQNWVSQVPQIGAKEEGIGLAVMPDD